jgi:hypothetical protein
MLSGRDWTLNLAISMARNQNRYAHIGGEHLHIWDDGNEVFVHPLCYVTEL